MTMSTIFAWVAGLAVAEMALLWAYQYWRKDATIVDVGWALGLALTALFFLFLAPGEPLRRSLTGLLAFVWAARLTSHLFINRVLKHRDGEDGRYQRMRRGMGKQAQLGFFAFFQAQAGFVVLFALPIYAAAANEQAFGLLAVAGLAVGVLAILGESVADRQLQRFRSDPDNHGTTCREGLWRYSRHPNYFFEWLHWFAYALLATGSPLTWLGWSGPVIMGLFLWKVTGIPHTEKQALSHRPDYAEYQRTTSAFIPWPPKAPAS